MLAGGLEVPLHKMHSNEAGRARDDHARVRTQRQPVGVCGRLCGRVWEQERERARESGRTERERESVCERESVSGLSATLRKFIDYKTSMTTD